MVFILLLDRFYLKPESCTISVFIGCACVGAVFLIVHDTVHVTDRCRFFRKSVTHVVEF